MAKTRVISTKFWSDGFIIGLKPLERYLFLYFLTNEHTNICGIYELPMAVLTRESGLKEKSLMPMIDRFENKIYYLDGWVYLKNFTKHQSRSEDIQKGIDRAREDVPEKVLEIIAKIDGGTWSKTIPRQSDISNLTKPNLIKQNADAVESFERFWKLYPRRVNKKQAFKAWLKIDHTPETDILIFLGLENYNKKIAREGIEERYIAHAATWLNAERWKDEYGVKKVAPPKPPEKPPEEVSDEQRKKNLEWMAKNKLTLGKIN